MTPEELIRGAKLRRDEMRICVDPDLAGEYERLAAELADEREQAADSFAGGGRAPEIQSQIDEVLEAMEASTLTLTLQALPRREYRTLVEKHPPRKDANGDTLPRDQRYGVDYDAFYSELARRSIVEPILDAHTLDLLLDERLTDAQWEQLTSRAHAINRTTVDVPFSPAGSPKRRRSSGK